MLEKTSRAADPAAAGLSASLPPPPTSQAGSRDSIQGARTRSGRGFGKVGSLRPRAVEPAGPAALAVAAVAAVRQQLQWPRRVEV